MSTFALGPPQSRCNNCPGAGINAETPQDGDNKYKVYQYLMDRLKLFWNELGTTALVSHRGNLCARRIGLSFSICRMCSVAGPDKAKYRSGVKTMNTNFKAAVFAVVPFALAACAGTQLG